LLLAAIQFGGTVMAPNDATAVDSKKSNSSAIDQEAEIVQAEQASSVQGRKDEEVVAQEEEVNPGLPFSKARAIALVVTVTAASFLNVRVEEIRVWTGALTVTDFGRAELGYHSADHRKGAQHPRLSPTVDCIGV
jgi:hypothetical protein